MSRIQKNSAVTVSATILSTFVMYLLCMLVGWGNSASTVIASGFAGGALLMALVMYAIQHQRHLAAFAQKKAGDNTDVQQWRTVEIDLPFEQAFDLALDALQSLDGEIIPQAKILPRSKQTLNLHTVDRAIGRIQAGLRAKTFGIQDVVDFSRIEIQLQRLGENTTLVRIDSQPAMAMEVYDMGRHAHYANHLALYFRRESHHLNANQHLEDEAASSALAENPSAMDNRQKG